MARGGLKTGPPLALYWVLDWGWCWGLVYGGGTKTVSYESR